MRYNIDALQQLLKKAASELPQDSLIKDELNKVAVNFKIIELTID